MHEFPCATHRSRNGARASIVRVVYHAQLVSAMVDQQLNLPPNLCADSPLFILERLRYLRCGGESVSPLGATVTVPSRTEQNRNRPNKRTLAPTLNRREIERVKHAPTDYFLFSRSPPPLLLFTRISSMHLSLNSSFTSNPTFLNIANRSLNWFESRGNSITRSREPWAFSTWTRRFQCRARRNEN